MIPRTKIKNCLLRPGKINHRFEAVMKAAEAQSLLREKTSRIAGRIIPALIAQAKKITGIESDTELSEFAIANLALEDPFIKVFKETRGTVDPGLKLGY